MLPHHFVAHKTKHPAVVRTLRIVLNEAERAGELLDPARVRRTFSLIKLCDCRALADGSSTNQPKDYLIFIAGQVAACLGHFRGVSVVSAVYRHDSLIHNTLNYCIELLIQFHDVNFFLMFALFFLQLRFFFG